MSFDEERPVDIDDSDSPETPSGAPPEETPSLIGQAPRELPAKLEGAVLKQFAGWTIAGIVLAALCGGIGWWLEGDYRQLQELRHYGEIVQASAGNPLSDEDGQWLDVVYNYAGQSYRAKEIDVTREQYEQVMADGDGIIEMQVVLWPEEPTDAMSVAYIDNKSTLWFALLYGAGIALVAGCMVIGFVAMRRRKRLYHNGREVWADPATDVIFNNESRQYTLGVNYLLGDLDRFTQISWVENNGPVFHQATGRVLLLVDPARPTKAHLPTDLEIQALRSASAGEQTAGEQTAGEQTAPATVEPGSDTLSPGTSASPDTTHADAQHPETAAPRDDQDADNPAGSDEAENSVAPNVDDEPEQKKLSTALEGESHDDNAHDEEDPHT